MDCADRECQWTVNGERGNVQYQCTLSTESANGLTQGCPQVTVLLLASQVGPGLMELMAPLATQTAGGLLNGLNMPSGATNNLQVLQLSALESTLWSTLQGDVLYVVRYLHTLRSITHK